MAILQPGTRVGAFPVTRLMSAGGMGMLYEALHPVLRRRVVIKTVRSELARDEAALARFRREARLAARVRDERLPEVFAHAVLPDGTPYMVMEYLAGEDLAARLAKGPLAPAAAARLMLEVLEVLAKVHRQGIVHRDLKPQNIFLARSDVYGELPKLLDFGLAHLVDDRAVRPDEVLGTPRYMALEQADAGRPVGPWTDVFAAGVVLYECIAGERPWTAPGAAAYLRALRRAEPPRPLRQVAPHAPAALADVIHRALAVDPAGRFADAAAFARALEPHALARGDASGEPAAAAPAAAAPLGQLGLNAPSPVAAPRRLERAPAAPAGQLVTGNHQRVTALSVRFQVASADQRAPDVAGRAGEAVAARLGAALAAFPARTLCPGRGELLALFGVDQTREDDAETALRAAAALRAAQAAIGPQVGAVQLQMGLHAGFVTRQADGSVPPTDAVATLARRISAAAAPQGIVLSRAVRSALLPTLSLWAVGALPSAGAPIELFGSGEPFAEAIARRAPFIGREAELAVVEALLSGTQRPTVVAVLGPAGVGKSRLIEQLVERDGSRRAYLRAQAAHGRAEGLAGSVLRAALCSADDGQPPQPGALEQQLDALADALPEPARAALRRGAPTVRALVGLSPSQGGAADGGRGPVFDLVALALEAAGRRAARLGTGAPVLCVDDAHRINGEDAALLRALPRLCAGPHAPALLVSARVLEALELPAEATVRAVPLSPLSFGEVDALIDTLAGRQRVSLAARALVQARAGGSPLFVEELVGRLAERDLLDGLPADLRELNLPDSLFGLLLARVERLPEGLREVVRHLAVLGERFEGWLWGAVRKALQAEGDAAGAEPALEALVRAGILSAAGTGDARTYRFRQVLLRDAVYRTVLADNRRLVHGLAAEALAARGADDPRRYAGLLAHYSQAGALEPTVRYGRLEGRRAAAAGAWSEAVQAFRLAAELQDGVPGQSALERAQTLVDLAWLCLSTGDLEEALDRAADAIALLDAEPAASAVAARARAHTAAGQAAYLRHDWERAQTELELAEHLFARTGLSREAAYARSMLGFVLRSMGRPEDGLALAQAAWAEIEPAGGPGLLRVAHDLGNILRTLGRPADALQVFDRAAALADGAAAGGLALGPTDAWLAVAIRSARAVVHAQQGELDRAVDEQRWCHTRVARVGRRVAMMMTGLHLAEHLAQRGAPGDLQEAEALAGRVQAWAVQLRIFARAVRARCLLARVTDRLGRPAEAEAHLEAAERLGRCQPGCEGPWLAAAQALAARYDAQGRSAEADRLVALGRQIAADRYDADLSAAVEGWAQARGGR